MDMEDEFIDDGTPKQSKKVGMNFDKAEKARSPQVMKKARHDRMEFMKGASLSPMSQASITSDLTFDHESFSKQKSVSKKDQS